MRVAELGRALDQLELDRESALGEILPDVRALLHADNAMLYTWNERVDGWAIDRWYQTGSLGELAARFRELVPTHTMAYDPSNPHPDMRNRVVEATAWFDRVTPDAWQESPLCKQLFAPLGIAHHKHVRVLVCDGNELLAWFGTLQDGAPERDQQRVLTELIPAVRRRLMRERLLVDTRGLLARAIDRIAAPALALGPGDQILEANAAARALLDTRRDDVREALAGRPSPLHFDVMEVGERGARASRLAVLANVADTRIASSLAAVARRWGLTPRQRDVLAGLVGGESNKAIAARLAIGVRAVELHVTALLARADVESRSALVTAVLAGNP